jgi:hypothetical protein
LTDPTALGGNARGDVTQFRDTFQHIHQRREA